MSPRRALAAVLGVIVLAVAFVGGVVVGGHARAVGLTELNDPLRGWLLGNSGGSVSAEVLQLLRDRYYEKVDTTRLERASVQAIVAGLHDPYTQYLTADDLKALNDFTDRATYGVGLLVAQRKGAVVIERVYGGSPAAGAGVKRGDRIVAVDGRPIAGQPLATVVDRIRGPEGTHVRLAVRTGSGPPRTLDLTRSRRFTLPAVGGRMVVRNGCKVALVALVQFSSGSAAALRSEVQKLRDRGARAIVFDLRGDGGGLVREAIGVAGAFLPPGSPVATIQGLHSPKRTLTTTTLPVADKLPLYVLVDHNSASASEIVAGALRDARRGTLIGEPTFGKALVQTTLRLRDGGALKLTTQRYLTPSGYDLAKRGLPPAVRAVDDPATPRRDEALRRAIALAAAAAR